MNCTNCNTPLIPGNNTCPKCGALNMAFDKDANSQMNKIEPQEDILGDEFIELNDEEINITGDMAPPTLNVSNEEILSDNAKDIGATDDSNIYSPEGVEETLTPEEIMATRKNENVEIAIPSSVKPDENIDMPSDGSAPTITSSTETIGQMNDDATILKLGNKKIKIKMNNKKTVPQLFFIIGIIVFFLIGILVGSSVFKKNVCVSYNQNYLNSKTKLVANGKNNITSATNYTFKIPKDYYYDKKNGGILVYEEKGSWRIYIRPINGLYADLAGAKTSIKESLKDNSITVNQIKEMKVEKSNMLIIETTKGLHNQLVAFMDAGNDYVFFIEIVTVDNQYNYDLLTIAEDIAKNAVYEKSESSIEKVNINDIADLVVTVSEAHKSLTK